MQALQLVHQYQLTGCSTGINVFRLLFKKTPCSNGSFLRIFTTEVTNVAGIESEAGFCSERGLLLMS